MDWQSFLPAAIGVLVATIFAAKLLQKRRKLIQPAIVKALQSGGAVPLAVMLQNAGLKNSFYNKGKVLQILNPMIASGLVEAIHDPKATMRNRLDLMTYRLTPRALS